MSRSRRFLSSWLLAVACLGLSVGVVPAAYGQDEKKESVREALQKEIAAASRKLAEEISKVVGAGEAKLAERITKIVEDHFGPRLAELEKSVKTREERVTALEKELVEIRKKLEVALAAKTSPEPKLKTDPETDPKTKPTNAFLGLSHSDHPSGAGVVQVLDGGPAAAAGLKPGDIILSVDGAKVTSESLSGVLTSRPVGAEIKLGVQFGDKTREVVAKLVDREEFVKALEEAKRKAAEPKDLVLGIGVSELDSGLEIDNVRKNQTGEAIGLRVGDFVVKFNGVNVSTVDALVAEVKKVKAGQEFTVLIQRGKEHVKITGLAAAGPGGKLVASETIGPKEEEKKPDPKPDSTKPAYLGISATDDDNGVRVLDVYPDTGAAAYGVQKGDVITHVNGQAIDLNGLIELSKSLKAGAKIQVKLRRGDKEVEISDMVLGAKGEKVPAPGEGASAKGTAAQGAAVAQASKKDAPVTAPEPGKEAFLGVDVYFDEVDSAIVVMAIVPGSAAEKAGVQVEDILLRLGEHDVESIDQLERAIFAHRPGQEVPIVVRRGDDEVSLKVTLTGQLG